MNLYKILFNHYSPKDSEDGIITYLLAENENEVFEWLASEPRGLDSHMDKSIFNSWHKKRDEELALYDNKYNQIGTESYKEKLVRVGGEMFDDDADVSDTYYGVTHYGWLLAKENISKGDAATLISLGIAIPCVYEAKPVTQDEDEDDAEEQADEDEDEDDAEEAFDEEEETNEA